MQLLVTRNEFEKILDTIDNNIKESKPDILKKVQRCGFFRNYEVRKLFRNKVGISIDCYIRKRKLYFIYKEMCENPSKPIYIISDFYTIGSSSQFARSFKAEFGVTPTEAKESNMELKDNRISTDEVFTQSKKRAPQEMINNIEPAETIKHDIEYAKEEYGFTEEQVIAIEEFAEKFGITFYSLASSIFNRIEDQQEYYEPSPLVEVAFETGIKTWEEFDEICEYYGCKFWEVDSGMVDYYRENRDRDSVLEV